MEQVDIKTYIDIGIRRKWLIIIPVLLSLLGGFTYIMFVPKPYEAKSKLLIQAQRVSEEVVDPMVSSIDDRIELITQQVTSRPNLERIIRKYGLYSSSEPEMLLEEKVALFREKIKINPFYQTIRFRNIEYREICAFNIVFCYEDAKTAAAVTNTLASDFISENLRMREDFVLGTSNFLLDELKSVENKLAKKEDELKIYREKYMGGLPEQLQTNLSILERLEQQLDKYERNLKTAQNRIYLLKEKIAESTIIFSSGEPVSTDIGKLRRELASLELKYSENHPDIIRLRKMIAKVDEAIAKLGTEAEAGNILPGVDSKLRLDFEHTMLEIKDIQAEIEETQADIKKYELIIEESPKREQELFALKRDYNNLRRQYNTLFNRKVEAEIAVSMEKQQKGEQFRIIEPASTPTQRVYPHVEVIMVMALALGLGLGCGLAVLKEYVDTSYRTPEEVKNDLQLPILAKLPIQYTEKELKSIKVKKSLAYTVTVFGFILSIAVIVIASQGMDKTIEFIQNLFVDTGV